MKNITIQLHMNMVIVIPFPLPNVHWIGDLLVHIAFLQYAISRGSSSHEVTNCHEATSAVLL